MLVKKYILLPVFILLVCCPAVYAAEDDDSDMSMRVPDVRLLDVEPNSINFEPDLNNMVNGWTEAKLITAVVSANAGWLLTIKGSSDYWEGPYQKPISDIYWNLADGEFLPLSTQSTEVVSGGLSNQSGYPINIKVKLDISRDLPGDYYYYSVIIELIAP